MNYRFRTKVLIKLLVFIILISKILKRVLNGGFEMMTQSPRIYKLEWMATVKFGLHIILKQVLCVCLECVPIDTKI